MERQPSAIFFHFAYVYIVTKIFDYKRITLARLQRIEQRESARLEQAKECERKSSSFLEETRIIAHKCLTSRDSRYRYQIWTDRWPFTNLLILVSRRFEYKIPKNATFFLRDYLSSIDRYYTARS